MTFKLDCPDCGKSMLWKYLKKPLCPCCNAEDVEKVYASKTDQLHKLPSGKLPHNAEITGGDSHPVD